MTHEATGLRKALMRERAAHAQTKEAPIEAQARWEALLTAKSALSGVRDHGETGRALSGPETGVLQ